MGGYKGMCVYRVIEIKGKPSLRIDERTLYQQIREGKVQPQTMIDCDGEVLPAAQISALTPLFHQAVKPLAAYLQPSQAGYVPPDLSAHSARLSGTQIVGILVGVGCLALWFLSLAMPGARIDSHGQWQDVATAEGRRTVAAEIGSSR